MTDFPREAQRLLKRVPEGYTNKGSSSVVDLVSTLVANAQGGKTQKLDELKALSVELSELEQDFVATHNSACNRSMEQFMRLLNDLDQAKGMVGDLKTKILRLRRSMGSYTPDLVALYKRRQRNAYLLQILHAIQQIQSMDAKKNVLLQQKSFLQCANLMRSNQRLLEQWPVIRDSTSHRIDLAAVHSRLQKLLSYEALTQFVTSVNSVLLHSAMRRQHVGSTAKFAAVMERGLAGSGGSTSAAIAPHTTATRQPQSGACNITIRTSLTTDLEKAPLHECTRLWENDTPILSTPSVELLGGILLRGPVVIPAKTTVSASCPQRFTMILGLHTGREGGIQLASSPSWTSSTASGVVLGDCDECVEKSFMGANGSFDSTQHHGDTQDELHFYQRSVAAGETAHFPIPPTDASYVIMVVVPHTTSKEEMVRMQCLSSLHVVGGVGTVKSSLNQRLLEVVSKLLQRDALRKECDAYLEAFLKAFDIWGTSYQKKVPETEIEVFNSTQILSRQRDSTAFVSTTKKGHAEHMEEPVHAVFEYNRDIACLQSPLLRQFCCALYGELLEVLQSFCDIKRRTSALCFPLENGQYVEGRVLLDEEDLMLISKELLHMIDQAPQQDSDCEDAMKVAKRAVELLHAPPNTPRSQAPFAIQHIVGTRRAGWLGLPPRKHFTVTIKIPENFFAPLGVVFDDAMRIIKVNDGSIFGALGEYVGSVLMYATLPNETRVTMLSKEDLLDAISGVRSIDLHLYRKVLSPLVGALEVMNQISNACIEAGRELSVAEEHIISAEESLHDSASQAMEELSKQFSKKNGGGLSLKDTWEALQDVLAPLLKSLCSNSFCSAGYDGVDCAQSVHNAQNDEAYTATTLEKLLSNRGASRLPRLLEGAPTVKFSISSVDETAKTAEESNISQHLVSTPYNTIALYRLTVQFEVDARKILQEKTFARSLESFIEETATNDMLPALRAHYFQLVTDAMANVNPIGITDASPGERKPPPVLEAVLLAAEGLQAFFAMPKDLPFTSKIVRGYAEDLIQRVTELALAQIKVKLCGTFAGELVLPLLKQLTGHVQDPENIDEKTLELWEACCNSGNVDSTNYIAGLLCSVQKSRSLRHVENSQDLSFIAMICHSLEWFADQVAVHCADQGVQDAFSCVFASKTRVFSTVFPGRDDDDMLLPFKPICEAEVPLATVEIDFAYSKLLALSGCAFFALEVDLATRCCAHLDMKELSFDLEHKTVEPDEFVTIFNRDARRLASLYSEYLTEAKQRSLMQTSPIYVCFYLIRGLAGVRNKVVTDSGIDRLNRNVFALQQNLALLVPDPTQSDDNFFRVRRYYQMLQCDPTELRHRRSELEEAAGITYTDDEFQGVEDIVVAAHAKRMAYNVAAPDI